MKINKIKSGQLLLLLSFTLLLPVEVLGRQTAKIVADIEGNFSGWCANEGSWSWGNELMVGFVSKQFSDKGDVVDGHNTVDGAAEYHYLARSTDGGLHWKLEAAPQFDIEADGNAQSFDDFVAAGGMDFKHPDFALRCRDDKFRFSTDRGRTWSRAVFFPRFDSEITARTDYVVSGDTCFIFLSAKHKGQDCAFTVVATDRGRKMEDLGRIAPLYLTAEHLALLPELAEVAAGTPTRSVMPSTVELRGGDFVTALRRKASMDDEISVNWIECYKSSDRGRSWQFLSLVASTDLGRRNGNPAALTIDPSGTLAICYGYRIPPYGIRARTSDDGGRTWSDPVTLRADGRSWDLGYPRIFALGKNRFLSVYYIATKTARRQRIESTLWGK